MANNELINFKNNKDILFGSEREYMFSSFVQAGLLVLLFLTNFMTIFVAYIGDLDIASASLLDTDNGGFVFFILLLLLAAYILSIFFTDKRTSKIIYIVNVAFIALILLLNFFELESSTDFFGVKTGIRAGFALYVQILLLGSIVFLYFKKDYHKKITSFLMNAFNETGKSRSTSKFDEIAKAKILLDEGTLTEEEFKKIKEDLLK